MKMLFAGFVLATSSTAFAVTAADIQNSQNALESACRGNSNSSACGQATINRYNMSQQLGREVQQSMMQRDQERQRIQQEEIWRRQVR